MTIFWSDSLAVFHYSERCAWLPGLCHIFSIAPKLTLPGPQRFIKLLMSICVGLRVAYMNYIVRNECVVWYLVLQPLIGILVLKMLGF